MSEEFKAPDPKEIELLRRRQISYDSKGGIEKVRIVLRNFLLLNEIRMKIAEYTVANLVREYNQFLATGRRILSLPGFRGRCQIPGCENQTQFGGPLICLMHKRIYWSR